MLTNLKQADYNLIIIKDLGMVYPTSKSNKRRRHAIFKCANCGIGFESNISNVKKNLTTMCTNCINLKRGTHRKSNTNVYKIYGAMLSRCSNINDPSYKLYGERGITVCKEWKDSFEVFEKWYKSNNPAKHLSLDRIDNDKGYYPKNCRLATRATQSRNQRCIRSSNTSGYRGVSFFKRDNTWKAQIQVDGKAIHIGYYTIVLEAAKAYDNYVIKNNLEHTINKV